MEAGQLNSLNAAARALGVLSFFFQAEDGIRDLTVTGVQTCALPISLPTRTSSWSDMRVNLTGMRVSSCSVSAIRYNRAAGLAGASTLRRSLTTTAATPIIKIPANVSPRFIGIAAACHDSAYRGKKLATARCPAR